VDLALGGFPEGYDPRVQPVDNGSEGNKIQAVFLRNI